MTRIRGRQPDQPPAKIEITRDQASGRIEGKTTPGATIEAINLSTAPGSRLRNSDTFVLATSDASGHFSAHVDGLEEGDLVRMRSRGAAGQAGNWLDLRIEGMGVDRRNAQVALRRIGLEARGGGRVGLHNISPGRSISEPGAQLLFVNLRSGERSRIDIGPQGGFPDGSELPGRPGDAFSLRASDGRNNSDFSVELGKIRVPGAPASTTSGVDLADPAPWRKDLRSDGSPKVPLTRFSGPLFKTGATASDVKQGQIDNCYLPSAIASLADAQPGLFEKIVQANDDGSYSVTFQSYDWETDSFAAKRITVDGDLYARSWGGPHYGSSAGGGGTDQMELWWPIVEKAYATWKGGFDTIAGGGLAAEVFEDILGKPSTQLGLKDNVDAAWKAITRAIDRDDPICAGTYSARGPVSYTNTGVYGDHSYSLLGYEQRDGQRLVKLRNPWGQGEPRPGDGKNDGVFLMPLEKFMRLFAHLSMME